MVIMYAIVFIGCKNDNFDIGKSSEIEEKLFSIGACSVIESNIDAYYQLKSNVGDDIPLLLHVKVNKIDSDGQKISDVISLEISAVGTNNTVVIETSFDDSDRYSKGINIHPLSESEIIVVRPNEAEVAFLKGEFNKELSINEVSDDFIS